MSVVLVRRKPLDRDGGNEDTENQYRDTDRDISTYRTSTQCWRQFVIHECSSGISLTWPVSGIRSCDSRDKVNSSAVNSMKRHFLPSVREGKRHVGT